MLAQFLAPQKPDVGLAPWSLFAQFLAPLKDSVLGHLQPVRRLRTSAVQARTGVQGAEPPQGSGAQPQGSADATRRTGGRVGKPPGVWGAAPGARNPTNPE
ncbi:hypothetical protein GCM10010331_62680 [Streptomyces xanthochromogenes]|nr:hypothetical protein GCM10010331_62680 [Streptomyces xanthochromogenes]